MEISIAVQYYRVLFARPEESGNLLYRRKRGAPPPLRKSEEEFLLKKSPSGMRSTSCHAFISNVTCGLVVLHFRSANSENTGINIEDLVSIGAIGLIKAVNTFDPEKKSSWLHTPRAVLRTKF